MSFDRISPNSVLGRLGLESVINANSWITSIGGSVMSPEVLEAMAEAARHFVDMAELHAKAGACVAEVTGAEAGLVTAGCSAALVLQAASCMTGPDEGRAAQLPDTTGLKNEIIIQAAHRNRYDGAWRLAGAKFREVGVARTTALWELEAAITPRTAAIAVVYAPFLRQPLALTDVVRIAHAHDIPVIVDAAAELPPAANLKRFIEAGADLVAFSGGKGIGGPQASGILCGRRDLIAAAVIHSLNFESPHAGIGRPMKASKEAIAGLLAALKAFLARDHAAQWQAWQRMARTIVDAVHDVPDLNAVVEETHRQGPQAVIYFNQDWKGPSPAQVQQTLGLGDPPIMIGRGGFMGELYAVTVTLRPGEEVIVAKRLRSALEHGA